MRRIAGTGLGRAALLVGIPLCLRLLCLWQLSGDPFFRCLAVDARTNHEMASQIAAGTFTRHEPFWQPPLYPYFLAALYKVSGPSPGAARLVQALLGAISCWLIFRLGERFFGRRAGWISWGIAAAYGPLIFFDLQLLNAGLAVLLLLAALERVTAADPAPGKLLAGGFLTGLAAINVATFLIAIPVVAAWLVRRSSRARRPRRQRQSRGPHGPHGSQEAPGPPEGIREAGPAGGLRFFSFWPPHPSRSCSLRPAISRPRESRSSSPGTAD